MYLSRISSSTCCLTFHREQCSGALWGDTTECHGITRQVFSWKLQEPDHPIEVPMKISQHALPRSLPACNTNLMISFWTISFSMNCVSDIFWALKFHMFSLLFIDIYIFEKELFIYITQSKITYVLYNSNMLYDMLIHIHYLTLRMLKRLPHIHVYMHHCWKHSHLSHVQMKHNSLI